MSSEAEDLPEELLWRGDADDGSNDLGFFGDDLEDDFGGGSSIVMRRGTEYSIGGDDDDDDDPLGGLKILGSIHDSTDGEEEQQEEPLQCKLEEENGEEDFVKILEDSIRRDLPKYVLAL